MHIINTKLNKLICTTLLVSFIFATSAFALNSSNVVNNIEINQAQAVNQIQGSEENFSKPQESLTAVIKNRTETVSKSKFKKDSSKSASEQLSLVEKHIKDKQLPQIALDRLKNFSGSQQLEKTQKSLEALTPESGQDSFRITKADEKFDKKDISLFTAKNNQIIINRNTRIIGDLNNFLSEGEEIKLTDTIKEKAESFNGPLDTFNFVLNEIEYSPYFGSKKGAHATLLEGEGNDLDKASLLIALLRAKDIPARYKHANIKLNVRTVTDLLGVETAEAAGKILTLNDIPVTLYTQNDEPLFFVIEHFYVEAYFPYGYTRGTETSDDGESQWVPMDPTINAYYHEQFIDVVSHLKDNGFNSQTFFENYLTNTYQEQTPVDAFKQIVSTTLSNHPSVHYPDLTLDDARTHQYPRKRNFEFIPGSLPFEIVRDIDTYSFIPNYLRHKLTFNFKDSGGVTYFTSEKNISDLANKELYISYIPATIEDQTIIDSFETIYDVVPLSLVKVKPIIKINNEIIAQSNISFDLASKQSYSLEFLRPNGDHIDITPAITTETLSKPLIVGVTDAIALDVGRVIPKELRSENQVSNQSTFISNSLLYSAALDFIKKLEDTSDELSSIFGSSIIDTENKASVENAVNINYVNNLPYSFDWIGLKIDAVSHYKYFYRFSGDTKKYIEDFTRILGLESSLNESSIFEERFDVPSISTVKGIKLVNSNTFPNTSMLKITSANESIIDTLQISNNLKDHFHDLVTEGNIIYTPSKPITYGIWTGLFYISTNASGTEASYIIGEGLNGGYTVIEQWPNGWSNFWRTNLLPGLTATIIKPLNNQEFMKADVINWEAHYISPLHSWEEKLKIVTKNGDIGSHTLRSGYGTSKEVKIKISEGSKATTIECTNILDGYSIPATSGKIGEEMHIPLTIDKNSGIYANRYNGYIQYNKQDDIYSHPTSPEFFVELKGPAMTVNNVNNPWIDPSTGKYWNMSVDYAAFGKPAISVDQEKYYMNMRWNYSTFSEKNWHFGKKVWVKNPTTRKAIVAGVLEYGPHITTGRVAGGSPEVLDIIGARTDSALEYCWAVDQDLPYGTKLNY